MRDLHGGRTKKLHLQSVSTPNRSLSPEDLSAQNYRAHAVRPAAVLDAVRTLAGLMRELRDDISEEQFAELLGVKKRDVMLWERGYLVPDENILRNAFERRMNSRDLGSGGYWGLESSLDIVNQCISKAREREIERKVILEPISDHLLKKLQERPGLLFGLSPRKFEEVIAEIMEGFGADVSLTPNGRDRGRDIFAIFKTPVGNILTLVQCKRYAPDRKVGRPALAEFLYTIRDQDKANLGLVATTSAFSREAEMLAAENQWQLKLADFAGIKKWLEQYGNWDDLSGDLLWTPG
ncbi:MAG: restriction endonuclease [Betaproteobacteria bacterium]|nr:restriction endonuclease [Betaproteobacteria bacterium]